MRGTRADPMCQLRNYLVTPKFRSNSMALWDMDNLFIFKDKALFKKILSSLITYRFRYQVLALSSKMYKMGKKEIIQA